MTHLWNPSILIDTALAQELIQEQLHVNVDTISVYGEGWDNLAFLVNNTFVFRFPRRDIAIACMENEIAFLPHLAQHVSFPFSCPRYIGKPSPKYAYPFAGYPLIQGNMLVHFEPHEVNNPEIAHTLAQWLRELHLVNVQNAHLNLFRGEQDWRLNISHSIARCNESLVQYTAYFEAAGFNLKELQQQINHLRHFQFDQVKTKRYLHGDLYYKHIIADNNLSLTGLIDWGDTHIGSPGIDLSAAIMLFEGTPLTHFWETYHMVDEELLTIAAFRAFCHEMAFLPYAYEQKDENGIKWAKIALRRALNTISRF